MRLRRGIGFCLIAAQLLPATAQEQADPGQSPLLSYAARQSPLPSPGAEATLKQRLARVRFDLAKDPPPIANCAQTLGARRFAILYDDLGAVYSDMGDDAGAAGAFAKAIECYPRAGFLHAELAQELLHLGRYDEARSAAQRQLIPGREDFAPYALLVQLDFLQDRWADAITHSRLAVSRAPDDEQATYWQCYLWLAQVRAGTEEPALAQRRPFQRWPRPILEFLQGRRSEAQLVDAVKAESDDRRRREILSEALFYAGERSLAAGRRDPARSYFTATAGLNVTYFIEHHLALAELSKLRGTPAGPGR